MIDNINHEIIRESLMIFLLKVIGISLMIIISVIIAQNLGAEGAGNWYYMQSIISIFTVIGMLGLGNTLVKNASQSQDSAGLSELKDLKKKATILIITSSSVSILMILIFFYLFDKHYLLLSNNNFFYLCLIIIPVNILNIHISIYKGIRKIAVSVFFENILTPIILISLILFSMQPIEITDLVLYYILSSVISLLFSSIYWEKLFSGETSTEYKDSILYIIRNSSKLYIISLTNIIISTTDIIMLGFWESSSTIGKYGVSIKIATMSSIILIVVNTVVASRFSVYKKNEDIESISKLARFSTNIMGFISIIYIVIIFIIPDILLGLFGSEFIDAKNILITLSIGQFIALFTGPIAMLLMMTNYEKFHQNSTLLSAIINILLNFILIPLYGAIGAAIATSISISLKNIVSLYYVNIILKIRTIF